VAEQVGVSGDGVLEMESLICDVDRTIIEAKLAVNVNTMAVQKVVNVCNDKGALENVTDKEIVFEKGLADRRAESVDDKPQRGIDGRWREAGSGADVEGGDVKYRSLRVVGWRGEGGMGCVSLEGGDGWEERGLFEESSVARKIQESRDLTFRNRSPNLLSVKFKEEVLMWVDRRRVLYTRWRKVRIERCLNNFFKGGANVLLVRRR
jgi:hypothetical protein